MLCLGRGASIMQRTVMISMSMAARTSSSSLFLLRAPAAAAAAAVLAPHAAAAASTRFMTTATPPAHGAQAANLETDAPLKIGDAVVQAHTFSEEHVMQFAQLTGDTNPIHLDKEFAAATRFKKPIVHGVFMNAILATLMGMSLPGSGSIYISQTIQFKAPLHVGDSMVARVEVTAIDPAKPVVTLRTTCRHAGSNTILMDGEAKIMVPEHRWRRQKGASDSVQKDEK